MDRKLAELVAQIPRKNAEAEMIGDFPLRDQAPGKVDNPIPLQAAPKEADLPQIRGESLSRRRLLTDEEYAERKRRLPPLSAVPHRKRGKLLTFDQRRRDIEAYEKSILLDRQARIALSHAVKAMPKKWDR